MLLSGNLEWNLTESDEDRPTMCLDRLKHKVSSGHITNVISVCMRQVITCTKGTVTGHDCRCILHMELLEYKAQISCQICLEDVMFSNCKFCHTITVWDTTRVSSVCKSTDKWTTLVLSVSVDLNTDILTAQWKYKTGLFVPWWVYRLYISSLLENICFKRNVSLMKGRAFKCLKNICCPEKVMAIWAILHIFDLL